MIRKKSYLVKNQYLIRDLSLSTFIERQRSDWQSCCNASIAKQNRFSFAETNKIQNSGSRAGSSLQNQVFQKTNSQKSRYKPKPISSSASLGAFAEMRLVLFFLMFVSHFFSPPTQQTNAKQSELSLELKCHKFLEEVWGPSIKILRPIDSCLR